MLPKSRTNEKTRSSKRILVKTGEYTVLCDKPTMNEDTRIPSEIKAFLEPRLKHKKD